MKHIHKFTALTLCAALLLSGCNTDKSAVTTAVTEEVTTTTTAETTFAENTTASASTTTASATTTAAESPENTGKIYMDFDEASLSFDNKAFEIFENVFYGTWTSTGLNGKGEHYQTTLTYSESEFDFLQGVYPYGITETDEFYVMPIAGGGMMGCYLVEKCRPDVLYSESYEYDENGAFVVIDDNSPYYTDRTFEGKPEMPQSGEISRFGMLWLENKNSEGLGQALERYLNEVHTDEYGMEWKYAGGFDLPEEKRYLISRSENEVQLGIRFFDRKAYGEFLKSSSAGVPGEAFFIVDMTFDGNYWRINDLYRPLKPYIPPDNVGIKVKAPEKTITLTIEPMFDIDIEAIAADYSFDMIPDYKNDETWKMQKKYIEEKYREPEEAEKHFGETLEDWKKRDYFSKPNYQIKYVGLDNCDFVICKHLGFTEVVQLETYEIFLFVKDGKVVRATPMMQRSGLNMYIDGNDLYETAGGGDILHIDIRTGKYDYIKAPGWCSIPGINDDWIIFGNGTVQAYNRHTGEIVTPEPEISWCALDTFYIRLNGSRIEYTAHGHPNGGWYYDLETGESGEMPEIYSGMNNGVYESSLYTAKSYYNRKNGKSGDFSKITVTRKSDGLEKVFDFTGLIAPDMEEHWDTEPYHLWWGDWFITYIKGIGRIAVDFETEETANVVTDESGIYHISRQRQYGDRYMVYYWREENGSTLFGEIGFEIK